MNWTSRRLCVQHADTSSQLVSHKVLLKFNQQQDVHARHLLATGAVAHLHCCIVFAAC